MKPPADFNADEIALYRTLRNDGDTHSAAVDTILAERLRRRLFR